MSSLNRGPFKDASYQISIHLAKRLQRRRFFLEINHSEKRIVCGCHACLIMDRDEMSNLYRGRAIDASY
jgi:hypothetical protein